MQALKAFTYFAECLRAGEDITAEQPVECFDGQPLTAECAGSAEEVTLPLQLTGTCCDDHPCLAGVYVN